MHESPNPYAASPVSTCRSQTEDAPTGPAIWFFATVFAVSFLALIAKDFPDFDLLKRSSLPTWFLPAAVKACFISFVGTLAHAIMNWIMPRRLTVKARIFSGAAFAIALIATAQLLKLTDYSSVSGIFTVPVGVIVMEIVKHMPTTPPVHISITATDVDDQGSAKH